MTARRGGQQNNAVLRKTLGSLGAKKAEDWQVWRDRIWESLHAGLGADLPGGMAGLAALEQYMWRSKKERRCVECGEPGAVRQESSGLIPSVDHYWMCGACDAYWVARGQEEARPARGKKGT